MAKRKKSPEPNSPAAQLQAVKQCLESALSGGVHLTVWTRGEPFDASRIAERLNLWRMNGQNGAYYAPAAIGDKVEPGRLREWREMGKGDVTRYMKIAGLNSKPLDDDRISQQELILEYVCNRRLVHFAAPLAGYYPGVHYSNEGKPFIVLDGPAVPRPEEGDWSLIEKVLTTRLDNSVGPQYELFKLWLKRGVEPLLSGNRRKGPILILAGPNDCGKTFILHHVVTAVLGGREFDPTDYFKSEQGFNKGMMSSESLVMNEFPFGLDGASRLMLSEKLKRIAANDTHIYHPKGRDAFTVEPHFRLSISINDNAEKLRALPPLGNDFADKVILLKVTATEPMPMPTSSDEEEKAFAAAIRKEIPAFLHHLIHWTPPEEIEHGRFGMMTWQHPEITEALWEQEPANRFALLLDRFLFPPSELNKPEAHCWYKATELNEQLTAPDATHSSQFRALLRHEGACAQMLGIIHKREGDEIGQRRGVKGKDVGPEDEERRYRKRHTRAGNFWGIFPPK